MLLSIIIPNIKRLLQINHLFESFGTLGAGIFLLTIMEQYMLYACSERKDVLILPSWRITYLMLWNNKLFDMNVKFWKDNLNSTGYLHTSLSLVFVSRFSDYCQLPFLRKEQNSKWLTCLNRCALKHQITFQEMFFKSFLCFNVLSHREQA